MQKQKREADLRSINGINFDYEIYFIEQKFKKSGSNGHLKNFDKLVETQQKFKVGYP